MSEKIKPQHLARKAILYVRQSSPYQVLHKQSGLCLYEIAGAQNGQILDMRGWQRHIYERGYTPWQQWSKSWNRLFTLLKRKAVRRPG